MLALNSNPEVDTGMTSPKVKVFLKEDLADQKEWIFQRQFSIGRDSNADICIKDPTVSRFHAFVCFIGGRWWIRDMNSSNGTFINGKKVFKCQMDQQTRLQLGKTGPTLHLNLDTPFSSESETIFVDQRDIQQYDTQHFEIKDEVEKDIPESEATPAKKDTYRHGQTVLQKWHAGSKKWRKSKPLAVCVLLAGLILTGYVALQKPRGPAQHQGEINVAHNPATSEDARRSMNEPGEPGAAVNDPSNHPLAYQKERSDGLNPDEIRNYTADIYFNAAGKFADHHRWQPALAYYQNVDKLNPDYPQLDKKIQMMNFEISNQAAYEQGMALIKGKRFAQGIEQLHQIPENSVYHHEAGQLIVEAEKKKAQAAEEHEKKEAQALLAAEEQKAADAIDRALQSYADGDTKSSMMTLDPIISGSSQVSTDLKRRAGTLKEKIAYVKSLHRKADVAYKSGKIITALDSWKKLITADEKLLGTRNGYVFKQASRKIADEYGAMAWKAYADGDFPSAYQYSNLALDRNRNHPKALEVKDKLNALSKQLYQAGYIIESYNPEKAREKWKKILKICDSDTEYYKKALVQVGAK